MESAPPRRSATAPGIHPDAPAIAADRVPIAGLMLATPMSGGGVCDQHWARGYADLVAECQRQGVPLATVFTRNESDVQQARNRCLAEFLAGDCSHLLFVDADIGWCPAGVFRLIAHNQPIVGGTYRRKSLDDREYAVSTLPRGEAGPGGLVEVFGLGGGFLLIQRNAAERMAGAYRELHFELQDGNPSRAGWRAEMFNLFGAEMADGTRWSEDLSFCRRWRALGGKVWLDPHILLEHWGMACFTGHPAEMFRGVPAVKA
jgi:hypothetical protein